MRTRFLPFHSRPVRKRIEDFLRYRSGSFIVHGLGPWGGVAVKVKQRMNSQSRRIIPIVTIWSTMRHEHAGKLVGLSRKHGIAAWLRGHFEYRWMMAMVVRHDRAGITEADRVLVNYESVAAIVRNEFEEHGPLQLVPYAPESAFEDPLSVRAVPDGLRGLEPYDAPLIVTTSRHDSRKGLDVFLDALGQLRDRKVPFRACLVGPGPLLAVHRRLATKLELDSSTLITGYVTDPVAYLQSADIFVLPSIEEGSGSVSLLEAMQMGLAIVASDVDGIPEDVEHDDNAQLVPVSDAHALSQALERVITDQAVRTRLQRRSRKTFEERFSAARFSASLGDVYRDLLRGAGSS